MRFLSIKLVGFKRMALSLINSINITFDSPIQLILGSNGSGKSSLLRELTPLPPEADAYTKEGSKTISISKSGNIYLLTSTFSPKTEHSFIKNDEELNPGKTVTVFRDLVKQEFGITPEIQELLVGTEVFHSMSPSRRREWFTKLSDVNFDYALHIYNKLKERNRDISGALKLAKKHLVNETAKLITDEEEERLKKEAELTLNELNILIENNAPIDRPVQHYINETNQKLEELSILSSKLLRLKCVAPYGTYPYGINPTHSERDEWGEKIVIGFESVAEIDDYIQKVSHKITSKETQLNYLHSEHEKIDQTISILIKTGEEGLDSLQNKLQLLRKERDEILSKKHSDIVGMEPVLALQALDSVSNEISAIVMSIPENSDKRFSMSRLNTINDTLLTLANKKQKLVSDINRLEAKIAHLESHKANSNTVCPKCNHIWIPGFSEEALKLNVSELEKLTAELNALNNEYSKIEFEKESINEYSTLYKDYMRCVNSSAILRPFWERVQADNYIFNNPKSIDSMLVFLRNDLEIELLAKKKNEEIHEVMELIKSAELVGTATLADMQTNLAECVSKIDLLTSDVLVLQADMREHINYKKQLIEAQSLGDRINQLMTDVERSNATTIEMMRRETLQHCIRQLQSALALKESAIQAAEFQKQKVEDLKKQIEELSVEEEASKILMKKLSPNEGIIAESITGFIHNYVRQMNAIIKKIWAYPLIVKNCNMDEGELDYKFPLIVQTKNNTIPDVKLGSTAMREIIDLVFKLVAMKSLNLADIPLMLDEFSASFDETHRTAAGNLLKNLMETHSFSQLFMISHYENVYGVFTNAEICVLDGNNITIPSEYNKHVLIE